MPLRDIPIHVIEKQNSRLAQTITLMVMTEVYISNKNWSFPKVLQIHSISDNDNPLHKCEIVS